MKNSNILSGVIRLIPDVVSAFLESQAVQKEWDDLNSLEHAEREYLGSVYSMYYRGKITATEAKQAVELIFKDNKSSEDENTVISDEIS